jgi:hypothetical protein
MAYEDNPGYMKVVQAFKDSVAVAFDTEGNPLGAIMLMSDVIAEVILTSMPREQWLAATELLITRLENSIDRRFAKGSN